MEHERRGGIPAEIRADDEAALRVSGYAAIFGESADIGGWFTEEIVPGAFTRALQEQQDVVFLINHDGLPLARTRSGTLILTQDERGLRMETSLDGADPDVSSIVPKMRRGDLDKMSFAFRAVKQEWDESGEIPHRRILDVDLFDVAIVTTPAYGGTDIGLRCLKDFRTQRRAQNYAAAQRRMRMKITLASRQETDPR